MGELNIKKQTNRITIISILMSLAIVVSAFEAMLPSIAFLPPGFKLGLSNIVAMFTCCTLGVWPAIIVSIAKSLFVGLTRGFMAFIMSFSGGVLSCIIIGVLLKYAYKQFGLMVISIIGALVHNLAQYSVIYIITNTDMTYYVPFLILFAIITGSLTGLILRIILPVLIKLDISSLK